MESRVAGLERRLAALEGTRSEPLAPAEPETQSWFQGESLSNAATLIGRFLLIFGGAYLLRSITDAGLVPTGLGILLGAVYALAWLLAAHRAAASAQRRAAAAFDGGASVLLALPLAVEAVTRFAVASPVQGVVALTLYCIAALAVAGSRRLRSLAWLATAGGIATALALLNATQIAVTVTVSLTAIALAALAIVYWRRWLGLQWLGAAGALAGVALLVLLSGAERWSVSPLAALVAAVALFAAYLAGFAVRSHVLGRGIGVFETVQTLVSGAVMWWAGVVAAGAGLPVAGPLGATLLAFGAAALALALTPAVRAQRGTAFVFYSSLALALVVAGSARLLPSGPAAALWSLLALMMAWASGRTARVTLSLFATVLLLAAALASGILTVGWQALAGNPAAGWPSPTVWHLLVALSTVACLFVPVAQRSERWGALAKLPQLLALALSICGVGGLMVVYAAPLLAGIGGSQPSPAALAALRTGVLSAASVTLAISSRFPRWPEARWLVYPVLILVALKLFAEDFPHGRPLTLFVALALVGGALILVARLLRRAPVGG